jgi:hypothetical protein
MGMAGSQSAGNSESHEAGGVVWSWNEDGRREVDVGFEVGGEVGGRA